MNFATRLGRGAALLLVCAMAATGVLAAADSTERDEIAALKAALADQQRQLAGLQQMLERQQALLERVAGAPAQGRGGIGEVASLAAILPVAPVPALALPAPQAATAAPAGPSLTDVSKRVDGLIRNVAGFRFSGDFRLRFDLQDRSGNAVAGPLQNVRERYRLRFNVDKDLFFSDTADRPLAHAHVQLATAPFNNPLTMDTDFAGVDTRAPFSVAEAYVDLFPTKALTLRVGRTPEIFADNRQFLWDDDVRFNGFHETYRIFNRGSLFVEARGGQYILTNPNTPVVAAGSPYLAAGYALGKRVPSADLFDEGIVAGGNLNKKWSANATGNYLAVREPNQLMLASTAAGFPLLTSPIIGATLTGALPQTGNATTTAGGATYFATQFHILRGAFNLNYSGRQWMGHNFPFQLFVQATHNTGASIYNNAWSAGAAIGQTARLGDMQFQYQYLYKPANGFVSQFTDDDVGTATGVNVKVNALRVNFGITRFLAWENRLYIQNQIARNNPAIGFFVPLQAGTARLYRLQSQFAFTF